MNRLTKPLATLWCYGLWLVFTPLLAADRSFVSLTLCSDRLLMAIARPEQIAAMSSYSTDSNAMLDQVNTDKPIVEPRLSDLLPYANTTLLVNETFYPRLVRRLKSLGFDVIGINDQPQTPEELFQLIQQLGNITDNPQTAKLLIDQLRQQSQQLKKQHAHQPFQTTLALTNTGVADLSLPQFHTFLELLGLTPSQRGLTAGNTINFEALILANPHVILLFTDNAGYNHGGQVLQHPLFNAYTADRLSATVPLKYTYCFDHGVWQGAQILNQQITTKTHLTTRQAHD